MSLTITIPGAVEATIGATAPAVLTIGVGTPGATGPQGPAGVGVPAGGTAGQFLTKIDGTNYNTDWTTVNLSQYAVKANNLSDLASASTARTNLGLGTMSVVNDAPSDGSQYARKNAAWEVVTTTPDFISSVTSPLAVTSGNLTVNLSAYAPLASPSFTGSPTAPTATFGDNDTSIATTAFVQSALAGGTAIAKNLEVEVRNQSGASIPAGSIVYISGATGNKPLITLSQANNDSNSAQTMGFVKTTIANNGTGFVIVRGECENLDTSALTEGVQLYLSPTVAGAYTTTKPSAPEHLVYVGIVIRSHPTLGTILVAVQNGYELNEIHDVAIGTLADKDLLTYEASTDLWKNKSFSTLGLLTSADAATTYYPLTGNPSSFLVAADIAGKADLASPAFTGNVTITSNSTGAALFITQTGTGNILTLHDQASDTTFVAIDANGKVSTIPSTTAGAGLNIPHGVAPTTPVNGDIWTTTTGLLWYQNGATKQAMNLGDTQTVSGNITFTNANLTFGNITGGSTTNVAVGATNSGTSKTVNIGTNGVAGSTTNTTIGPVLGASTTSIGNTTAASTLNLATGATLTATTKAVNIGTNGVAGSTTNIAIGSTTGTSTTTLQGTTNGVTQTAGDSSLKLATTAFVTTADNLKANLASPTFTGTPLAPTATAGTNTTQIATTAFVTTAVPGFATTAEMASPSSTTKVVAPNDVVRMIVNRATFDTQNSSPTFATSGAGAEGYKATNDRLTIFRTPNAGVAGYGQMIYETTASSIGVFGAQRGGDIVSQDYSKKIWMSGTVMFSSLGDANTVSYCMMGGRNTITTGDPTMQGFGWKLTGGGTALKLISYGWNGSALVVTETASSFTPVVNQTFDWMLLNEGTGAGGATSTCKLYVNDSLVASGVNAPGGANVNFNYFFQSAESTASVATPMRFLALPVKVWWSRS